MSSRPSPRPSARIAARELSGAARVSPIRFSARTRVLFALSSAIVLSLVVGRGWGGSTRSFHADHRGISIGATFAQAPSCGHAVIRSPFSRDRVQGVITIFGSADVDAFIFYKLEWAPQNNPEVWSAVSSIIERPVRNGVLDTLDTRSISDGTYRLKLTVVDDRYQERCRFTSEGLEIWNRGASPELGDGASDEVSPNSDPIETPIPTARALNDNSEQSSDVGSGSTLPGTETGGAEASPIEEPSATELPIIEVPATEAQDTAGEGTAAEGTEERETDLRDEVQDSDEQTTEDPESSAGRETTTDDQAMVTDVGGEGDSVVTDSADSTDPLTVGARSDGDRFGDAARAFGLGAALRSFGLGFAAVLALAAIVWRVSVRRRSAA